MTTVDNIDKEIKATNQKLQEAINAAASRDIVCNRIDAEVKTLERMKQMIQGNGKADADVPPPEPEKKAEKTSK
jgi:hypothetical protein